MQSYVFYIADDDDNLQLTVKQFHNVQIHESDSSAYSSSSNV